MIVLAANPRAGANLGHGIPLGMLQALAYLRRERPQHAYGFRDFDQEQAGAAAQAAWLEDRRPDLFYTSAAQETLAAALDLARLAKAANPACLTVLGGNLVTAEPAADYPGVDLAVAGEAEPALLAALDDLAAGRRPTGSVGPLSPLADLDLPLPLDLLPAAPGYRVDGHPFAYAPVMPMLSSRGCPNRCAFCASLAWRAARPAYRRQSPEHAAEEVARIHRATGLRYFYYYDDAINADLPGFRRFLAELRRRRLPVRWGASFLGAARYTPEDLFPELREAGCVFFSFGVETGSPRVLKAIGKPIALEEVERALALSKAANLASDALFMLGHAWYGADGRPEGETAEDLARTRAFIRGLADRGLLFAIGLSIAKPYPGTELGRLVREFGLAYPEAGPEAARRRACGFRHPHLSDAEIQRGYQDIWRTVSLHPRVLWNQLRLVRNLDEVRRLWSIARQQLGRLRLAGRLTAAAGGRP